MVQWETHPGQWTTAASSAGGKPPTADDASPLRSLLSRLLFDAAEALPEGGEVQFRARREQGRMTVEIQDAGARREPEAQARAFESLFAAAPGSRQPGLAQLFLLLYQNQAELTLGTAPDGGVVLRMSFALSASTSESAAPPAAPERIMAPGRLRTLVVEDQEELRRTVANMLLEHEVVHERDLQTAATAEEALNLLMTQGPVDLLITDLNLGAGMNGWQLVEQVHDRWPATHVALATAWGAVIGQEEAQLRGVEAVLSKPFRIAEIQRLIDAIHLNPRLA
jgi:CheY-like chemotaxis protein